jgi:hypothetical protein
VYVSGARQRLTDDWVETDSSTFTLLNGVPEGTIVLAVAYTELQSGAAEAAAAAASAAAALASENAALASELAAAASAAAALASEGAALVSELAAAQSAIDAALAAASVGFTASSSTVFTNKTIDLTDNTLNGTKAEFNSACSDGDFLFVGDVTPSDVTSTNTITLTNKTALALTNTIEARSGPDSSAFSFRNKIVGGDFTTNPWQRGTSFTALASGSYGPDRFLVSNTSAAVVDCFKTADAPTIAQAGVYSAHCVHLDVTTADASIAAGDFYNIQQRVEGLNAASFGFGQAGTRYVTFSFWHKHTKIGTYCVGLTNSATNRSYVAEYVQDVTDTWEKAIITIPVDTSGTWLYDNGIGILIRWAVATGSTYQTTANTWAAGNYFATANQVNALDNTANNFKLALIQLEAGQTATPFETLDEGNVLRLCQRYYYRTAMTGFFPGVGSAISANAGIQNTPFPVTMRSAPTALEQTGTAGNYRVYTNAATTCTSVPAFDSATVNMATTNFTATGGLTGLGGAFLAGALGGAGYLGWSVEL